jgi:diketogulonate reductase-like aldo/keto reductase
MTIPKAFSTDHVIQNAKAADLILSAKELEIFSQI